MSRGPHAEAEIYKRATPEHENAVVAALATRYAFDTMHAHLRDRRVDAPFVD